MKYPNSRMIAFHLKKLNLYKIANDQTGTGLLVIPNGVGYGISQQGVFQNVRINERGRESWKQD